MSKDLNISRLCDAYGGLLTEHRREIIRNYYDYDLSLAEIAENLGITRQAALCSVKQAERQLRDYERTLRLVERSDKLKSDISRAMSCLDDEADEAKRILTGIIVDISGSIGD